LTTRRVSTRRETRRVGRSPCEEKPDEEASIPDDETFLVPAPDGGKYLGLCYPKREVRPNGGQSRCLDPILLSIYTVLMFRRENPCLQPFGARTAAANAAMVDSSTNDTSRAISNITVTPLCDIRYLDLKWRYILYLHSIQYKRQLIKYFSSICTQNSLSSS
jgi:hypothetical protein